MKQVLQSLKSGATEVADVPSPGVRPGCLLIATSRTLVSAGTERMLLEFGQASMLAKARQQPDKVAQVLDKIRTDGLGPTLASIRNKLDQPLPLGYSNVGSVIEVGLGVTGLARGDRVVSNGSHAEIVRVPANLCVRVPADVTDDQAAFSVLGAIGLQGIRLAKPTLGEAVVVTGLGLIGLLTVQLLRAQGCRVLGIDLDPARLALARRLGAETVDPSKGEDPIQLAHAFSRGRGVDAVLITAATQSNEPMHQAALMCRQRGRIVLVGVAGLQLSRSDLYKKEIQFQVSCSYGPGRYDTNYEEKGHDYPVGFVRWTEQRNFEAVLDMLADRRLEVAPLISHRFPIAQADQAYRIIASSQSSLGILLEYPSAVDRLSVTRTVPVALPKDVPLPSRDRPPTLSFIGSGNYASAVLMPAFKAAGVRLHAAASSRGVTSLHAARKFGFSLATTDTSEVFADSRTDAVVIATRHDSHARLIIQGLSAGKAVFVEKPLCLTLDEHAEIEVLYTRLVEEGAAPRIMVGFNRRFAAHVVRMRSLLATAPGPKAFVMTVNAGAIPTDHWAQDRRVGGGRILGEACHFIDLLRFLAGSPVVHHSCGTMRSLTGDTVSIQLSFADDSIGTVHYFANGHKRVPKERLDVFAAGRILQLDNFRILRGFGWPGFRRMRLWRQDKGHRACAAAFVRALEPGGSNPIPIDQILEVSRVAIEVAAD